MTSGKLLSITAAPSASRNTTIAIPTSSGGSTGGLSTGAKIGVGVGVPVGLILLALIGAFLLLRRRKRQQAGPPPHNPGMEGAQVVSAGYGDQQQQMRDSTYTANMLSPHGYMPSHSPSSGIAVSPDKYTYAGALPSPGSPMSDVDEATRIQQEQSRLEERKQRLLQLEQIEQEQSRLRQQAERLRPTELDATRRM